MAASHDTLGAAAPQGQTNERFGWPISQDAFEKVLAAVPLYVADAVGWRYLLRGFWEGGFRPEVLFRMRWDEPPRGGHGYVLRWTPNGVCTAEPRYRGTSPPLPVCSDFERLLLETPASARSGRVFLSIRQGRLDIETTIRRIGELAGIKLTSADLRMSWAKRQLGILSPEVIGTISRHKDPLFTRRFCEEAARLPLREATPALPPVELPEYATLPVEESIDDKVLLNLFERFASGNRAIRHPKTRLHYLRAIRQFGESLGKPATVDDLTDDSLVQFEKSLDGLAVSTINERLRRVKAIWTWCCKKGLKRVWPTIQAQPEPEPHRRAWTVEEVRRLLAACDEFTTQGGRSYDGVPAAKWWRLFHLVAWETGERTGALLELKWAWLSDTGLDVPAEARKGRRKSAYYRLSADLLRELSQFRTPEREMVFPWSLSLASFWNHYTRLLKLAGLPHDRKCKPQKLRRSHLTWWAIGGQNATERAKHSDPMTTMKSYLDETLFPQIDPSSVLPSLAEDKGVQDV